ncbi:hypothetical protein B0H13DRAFT_1916581 [Mycena leptocephala]|nr:hypothetical protein B0H13DRAFT_1916581 [Mycena leptocephala]
MYAEKFMWIDGDLGSECAVQIGDSGRKWAKIAQNSQLAGSSASPNPHALKYQYACLYKYFHAKALVYFIQGQRQRILFDVIWSRNEPKRPFDKFFCRNCNGAMGMVIYMFFRMAFAIYFVQQILPIQLPVDSIRAKKLGNPQIHLQPVELEKNLHLNFLNHITFTEPMQKINGSFGWPESPIGEFDNPRSDGMDISQRRRSNGMEVTDRKDSYMEAPLKGLVSKEIPHSIPSYPQPIRMGFPMGNSPRSVYPAILARASDHVGSPRGNRGGHHAVGTFQYRLDGGYRSDHGN